MSEIRRTAREALAKLAEVGLDEQNIAIQNLLKMAKGESPIPGKEVDSRTVKMCCEALLKHALERTKLEIPQKVEHSFDPESAVGSIRVEFAKSPERVKSEDGE